jgi:hypothetical protein
MNTSKTFSRIALAAAAALVLSNVSAAQQDNALEPVYLESSQYTATLQPQLQRWTLAPQIGGDLEIRSTAPCPHQVVPSKGLWVIGRDAEGGIELIAPSATLLPAGHSGRVALRSCDAAGDTTSGPAFGVPERVLELLAAHSGAVLVDG